MKGKSAFPLEKYMPRHGGNDAVDYPSDMKLFGS